MLEYTFKKDNRETTYTPLDIIDKYVSGTGDIIMTTSEPHNLRRNDTVFFTKTADGYSVSEEKATTSISPTEFSIEPFEDYVLNYSATTYEAYQTGFSGDTAYELSALTIAFDTPHDIFDEPQFISIDNRIPYNYYSDDPDWYMQTPIRRACVGDTVEVNGLVYRSTDVDENSGKYKLQYDPYGDTCLSKRDVVINYVDFSGDTHTIDNGFVMVDYDGREDLYRLVFFAKVFEDGVEVADRTEELQYINENSDVLTLYVKDERFLYIADDVMQFKPVTTVYRNDNYYSLDLPISDSYRGDIFSEYNYQERYLSEKMTESVNPIVDYEKRVFEPAWYNGSVDLSNPSAIEDSNLKRIDEIVFNLHFRARDNEGRWEPLVDGLWNNYSMIKTISGETSSVTYDFLPKDDRLEETDADLLSYLDFKDGDVYYQKNRLKKSFLRLLFFDTPDRRTQTLQFYSTIFFNTNAAYKNFLKSVVAIDKNIPTTLSLDNSTTYVGNEHLDSDDNKDRRLCARFTCHDRMNSDNSSDGYYLYLFPSVLHGTIPSKLYMQVQFNHAGYGKVVDMVMPVDDSLVPIPTSAETFPLSYTDNINSQGEKSDDWEKFVRDRYIEIWTKYNFDENKYQWFLPRMGVTTESENKMVFNLYEPILTSTSITATQRVINEYKYTDESGQTVVVENFERKYIDYHIHVHMGLLGTETVLPATAEIKAMVLNNLSYFAEQTLDGERLYTQPFAVNTTNTTGHMLEGRGQYTNNDVRLVIEVEYGKEENPLSPNTEPNKKDPILPDNRFIDDKIEPNKDFLIVDSIIDETSTTGRRTASNDPEPTDELPAYVNVYVSALMNESEEQPTLYKRITEAFGVTIYNKATFDISTQLSKIYNKAATLNSDRYQVYLDIEIQAFPKERPTPTPVPDDSLEPIEQG